MMESLKDAAPAATGAITAGVGFTTQLAMWQSIAGIVASCFGIVATAVVLYWRYEDRKHSRGKSPRDPKHRDI